MRACLLSVAVASLSPACEARDAGDAVPVRGVRQVIGLEGEAVDPFADRHARAVVLVFVTTECPISNRYAPTLVALAERWTGAPVRVWLVYPDPDDGPAAIRAHLEAYGLRLPVARDPEHALVARSGARVTPEAAVFRPGESDPVYRGPIDDRARGFGDFRAEASVHSLRDAVDAILRGETPRAASDPAVGCYISDLR